MKVLVSWDANNIWRKEDNSYWSDSIHSYSFVSRYLNVFDEVALVSRVFEQPIVDEKNMMRVDGLGVEIRELPMLRGIKGFALGYPRLKKAIKKAVKDVDCAIIRIPSVIGYEVLTEFQKTGKPYEVEVVVDPYDAYKNNRLVQIVYTHKLKKAVQNANGASYVTEEALQKRYPPAARTKGEDLGYFESYYSSIDLKEDFFAEPRTFVKKESYRIIHTANAIHHDGKGHIELIKALKIVRDKGYDVSITFIGDGSQRKNFENFAFQLGLGEYIEFTGLLTGAQAIRNELISGDMFVLPTKYEGLPRSVIEAMAVGLPCIATPVGGTGELLESQYLVDPEDIDAIANRIIMFIDNPDLMTKESARNIKKAEEFRLDILTKRRNEFYKKLKAITIENEGDSNE